MFHFDELVLELLPHGSLLLESVDEFFVLGIVGGWVDPDVFGCVDFDGVGCHSEFHCVESLPYAFFQLLDSADHYGLGITS